MTIKRIFVVLNCYSALSGSVRGAGVAARGRGGTPGFPTPRDQLQDCYRFLPHLQIPPLHVILLYSTGNHYVVNIT